MFYVLKPHPYPTDHFHVNSNSFQAVWRSDGVVEDDGSKTEYKCEWLD